MKDTFLMKKTVYTASISLLIGFSLATGIANYIIPLFWERRLFVKLGLLSVGTILLSALAYLTIIRLIWPFFKKLTKNQRIVYLLLIAGGVIAFQYFLPPPLPKVHNTFEIQTLPNTQNAAQANMPSIMEIRDINGNKVPFDALELNDGWEQVEGMLVPQAGKAASLKYQFIGEPGKQIHVLFLITEQSSPISVGSNGIGTVVNFPQNLDFATDEFSEGFEVKANPAIGEHLMWMVFITPTFIISLILILMVIVIGLTFIYPHISPQVTLFFDLLEKRPWLPLALIAIPVILMFWPQGSYYSPDVAYYLSLAKNLFHGRGYVQPNLAPELYRGPVFPLLISLGYLVFGEVLRSALIVERIFWVLTVLMTYLLAKQLFNARVGFFASLFILSASIINMNFYYIWTDGVLVCVLLGLQLIFWRVYKKQGGYKWYVLMGFLMGMAYLLKQTAIFIVPLPLLIWAIFSEYRTRQVLKRLIVCYAVFALFLFGWMGYVYLAGGSPGQVAGDFKSGIASLSYFSRSYPVTNTGAVLPPQAAGTQSRLLSILGIFDKYYWDDIASVFNIAILFPIALIFILYLAILKKVKPFIFLGLGLLLFTPLIPVQVGVDFGSRYNLYFYIIVLISIVAIVDEILNLLPFSRKDINFLVLIVTASILFWHASTIGSYLPDPHPVTNQETLDYFDDYARIAAWVDQNIKPDEKILVNLREGEVLHILTSGNRTFDVLNTCLGEDSFIPAIPCTPPYINFWNYSGATDPNATRNKFLGISEPALISTIRNASIENVTLAVSMPQIRMLPNDFP